MFENNDDHTFEIISKIYGKENAKNTENILV